MLRDPVPPEKCSSLQLPPVPHCGRNKILHGADFALFEANEFNIFREFSCEFIATFLG